MLFNQEEEKKRVLELGLKDKAIAILDDSPDTLGLFTELYSILGLRAKGFKFPDDLESFWEDAENFDFILLDHRLGGTNGANVASKLMKSRAVHGRIFLFTASYHRDYAGFKYYFNKTELLASPSVIFTVEENIIERAVETSVLQQLKVTA